MLFGLRAFMPQGVVQRARDSEELTKNGIPKALSSIIRLRVLFSGVVNARSFSTNRSNKDTLV